MKTTVVCVVLALIFVSVAHAARKCGDGVVSLPYEQCDNVTWHANPTTHKSEKITDVGCSALCTVKTGYRCVVIAMNPIGTGPYTKCSPSCGDGIIAEPEKCDDGNMLSGDGCSSSCLIENGYVCTKNALGLSECHSSMSPDFYLTEGEDCTGNNRPGCFNGHVVKGYYCPTASGTCAPICGDGYWTADEECDDSDLIRHDYNDYDGCDSTCHRHPAVGSTAIWRDCFEGWDPAYRPSPNVSLATYTTPTTEPPASLPRSCTCQGRVCYSGYYDKHCVALIDDNICGNCAGSHSCSSFTVDFTSGTSKSICCRTDSSDTTFFGRCHVAGRDTHHCLACNNDCDHFPNGDPLCCGLDGKGSYPTEPKKCVDLAHDFHHCGNPSIDTSYKAADYGAYETAITSSFSTGTTRPGCGVDCSAYPGTNQCCPDPGSGAGYCSNSNNDFLNCGGCSDVNGTTCHGVQICCPSARDITNPNAPFCITLKAGDTTSFKNCGACGRQCPQGLIPTYVDFYGTMYPQSFSCCQDTTKSGSPFDCYDVNHNSSSCGSCGTSCNDDTYCRSLYAGNVLRPDGTPTKCVCCPQSNNKGNCVDIQQDSVQCGTCNLNRCQPTETCYAGRCSCDSSDKPAGPVVWRPTGPTCVQCCKYHTLDLHYCLNVSSTILTCQTATDPNGDTA